jgi:hypothetical protein
LSLLLFTPLLVLLLAEGGLRLFRYGDPTSFLSKTDSGNEFITNEKFARQFFSRQTVIKPFLFSYSRKKASRSHPHLYPG